MARWVRRIPETTRAHIQVEDWLRRLGYPRPPFVRVLRLARLMEVRGVALADVYAELRALAAADLTNDVVREMRRRRALWSPANSSCVKTGADGSLRPLEPPVHRC